MRIMFHDFSGFTRKMWVNANPGNVFKIASEFFVNALLLQVEQYVTHLATPRKISKSDISRLKPFWKCNSFSKVYAGYQKSYLIEREHICKPSRWTEDDKEWNLSSDQILLTETASPEFSPRTISQLLNHLLLYSWKSVICISLRAANSKLSEEINIMSKYPLVVWGEKGTH